MLTLSNLKRPVGYKRKKRLGKGQGSGTGKQAGRGHKGTKARAGGRVPARFEGGQMPLQRRLPKRGFKNIFKVEYRILNICRLQELPETEWDIAKLEAAGLIIARGKKGTAPVKILAGTLEEFTKVITIKANAFSKNAVAAIEKNGGKAEVI
jgi:large subunit ribosomal protein L15